MDTSEMRELLRGYLSELDWTGGATKDDLMAHLAGRNDALRTMVNQYVAEGTYQNLDQVMSLIPAQAWQDVQGDAWRGAESQYAEDVPSHFEEGRVGQDDSDVYRAGGSPPPTPGFGQSAGATGGAAGASGATTGAGAAAAAEAGSVPRGGMPGDGAGRVEDPGTRDAGVWPVSGPPSGNPDARIHDMASFGQGERGAAGYAGSGESEVRTIPPGGTPAAGEPAAGE